MAQHRYRLGLIAVALVASCAALALLYFVPSLLPGQRGELMTALSGAVVVLVPALVDAVRVELRRRDPTIPAIADDMRAPTDPGAAIGLLVVAAVVAMLHATGCGASPVATQARIASTITIALQTAGGEIDAARTRALDDVEHRTDGLGTEARLAALEAEAAHWRPVGEALDAARDVMRTWTSSIALAHAGGDASLLSPIAEVVGRAFMLYERIAALARELGTHVPDLPPEVRALASAIAGGA